MKKSFFWGFLLGVVFLIPAIACAEQAIIKDINVEIEGASVKITIVSNQTLQIETFKSEEGDNHYIVLDFLGAVYTSMSSVIEIDSGSVDRVTLVKGEESGLQQYGESYYSLDFLAINLNSAADYQVRQTKSVIDMNIETATMASLRSSSYSSTPASDPMEEEEEMAPETVELKPPIVVSKAKQEPVVSEKSTAQPFSFGKEEVVAEEKPAPVKKKKERKPRVKKAKVKPVETAMPEETSVSVETAGAAEPRTSKGFLFFKKKAKEPVSEDPVVIAEYKPRKSYVEPETTYTEKPSRSYRAEKSAEREYPLSDTERDMLENIVNNTLREKDSASARIESLTMELKRLQDELGLSKDQKSRIDGKINEILAKLDELQGALDDAINRKKALGQKVDDLILKREAYLNAKKAYEDYKRALSDKSMKVDMLNSETQSLKAKLDALQTDKMNLERDINTFDQEYSKAKSDLDNTTQLNNSLTVKIEQLSRELEQIRRMLDETQSEKAKLAGLLREMESRANYNSNELARLKKLLMDKNAMMTDLAGQYERLKADLDASVSDKFKVEYSYRNAKVEFERIKREIEEYLKTNQ